MGSSSTTAAAGAGEHRQLPEDSNNNNVSRGKRQASVENGGNYDGFDVNVVAVSLVFKSGDKRKHRISHTVCR